MSSLRRRHWLRWVTAVLAAIAVLAVGGLFAYIHVTGGGAAVPLVLRPGAGGGAAAPARQAANRQVGGTWQVAAGSMAGYRVREVLFGQGNVATGRTSSVYGQLTITGTTVIAGTFTVQLATVRSGQSQRDAQFDGRIMNVAAYPAATFRLTRPIRLAPVPAPGVIRAYRAAGVLTLHGRARRVSFPLTAERTAAGIEVQGSIRVTFASWGIPSPGFGGFVTTQNHGELEFLLKLAQS